MTPPNNQEPPDHHLYEWLGFEHDTFKFYFNAVKFYASLLDRDVKLITEDEDLQAILGDRELDSFSIAKEINRAQKMRQWFEDHFKKQGRDAADYDVQLVHGVIRFLKSAGLLYLQHLRQRRQVLANRRDISKAMLEAVDQQLARFEEKTEIGVFRAATPYPIALSQLSHLEDKEAPAGRRPEALHVDHIRPRPVILDTIEIRDPELRKRCLDLLAQFREDGQHDRLDTVVNEATRILEDRLRLLSKAPATCVGVDLAKHAFGTTPNLIVSDIPAEQESAHLLYRGVFGFIRNSVHHRLIGNLQPERVLQIVGMADYLISVAEAAQTKRRRR
jgi:hypothetical protein